MTEPSSRRPVQTLVGAGVALVGLGAGGRRHQHSRRDAGYGGVGANFLPWLVAAVLIICGVMIVRESLTGGFRELDEPSGAEHAYWPGARRGCRRGCCSTRR